LERVLFRSCIHMPAFRTCIPLDLPLLCQSPPYKNFYLPLPSLVLTCGSGFSSAFLARPSAFSLPPIPTWAGIHRKVTEAPLCSSLYRHRYTSFSKSILQDLNDCILPNTAAESEQISPSSCPVSSTFND